MRLQTGHGKIAYPNSFYRRNPPFCETYRRQVTHGFAGQRVQSQMKTTTLHKKGKVKLNVHIDHPYLLFFCLLETDTDSKIG